MPSTITTPTTTPSAETTRSFLQMTTGYWVTQALYVAAKLGIADLLKNGPQPITALAATLEAHEDFLYRVLRTLCSVGVFEETGEKTFQLSPMAQLLRSDVPQSFRHTVIMLGEEHYMAWGHLKNSVLSGKLPFESVYGMPVFEYFEKHPEAGETFNRAMTEFSANINSAIGGVYDFSPFKTVVDIGGGHGRLLAGILQNNPHLRGILFDLPHVLAGAPAFLEQAGVAERCDLQSGDFFQSVAAGGDVYVLSHIIHDWSDELATRILISVHHALNENGRVLVVEDIVEPGNTPCMAKFMDLNMLVMTPGGRERTEAEYRNLFATAGFTLSRIIPTPSGISVVEGIKH